MKRIVLIILILINLYVLALILLRKIDSVQENFSTGCASLPQKLTINVGSSGSNVKTVGNIQNLHCYDCPTAVNKSNFFSPGWAKNVGDIFNVKTFPGQNKVEIKRTDAPTSGWGMNLKFQCNKKPTAQQYIPVVPQPGASLSPLTGSCQGSCGGKSKTPGSNCFCDSACESFNDCCTDKNSICSAGAGSGSTPSAPPFTPVTPVPGVVLPPLSGSCEGSCNGKSKTPGSNCFCDTACHEYNDCCNDIATKCPTVTPVSGPYNPMLPDPQSIPGGVGGVAPAIQEFEVPGGSISLYNVNNVVDKFYEVDSIDENCQNSKICSSNNDCSASQECADIFGDGVSKCYSFVQQPSFELESQNNSFIKLVNNNTKSFSFIFGFVLKNSESLKYLVSSKSNLWSIYNHQNDVFLNINDNAGLKSDKIKLSKNKIMCYKLYEVKITLTQKKINVNFNNQLSSTDAFFKLSECASDANCVNGECLLNKCVLTSDEYYFGKLNNQYFDMFIGGVKINTASVGSGDDSCSFSGKDFKNKKLCIETCKNKGCELAYCDYECEKVPVCEFETIGRHSVDCIQECIKNNDCTSEYCIEKCENCEPNCPWNKKNASFDDYDSQFFDPQGKPSPLKLTLNTISTDGTKVSVRWRSPFEGKSPIKGYMSYLYKTFNKSEGVKINKISLKNCEPTCEYIIKDLIPNETYTLGLKSYNDIGLSRTSNLLTFKASITNINMDLRIEDEVSENDIGDFNYCNA